MLNNIIEINGANTEKKIHRGYFAITLSYDQYTRVN